MENKSLKENLNKKANIAENNGMRLLLKKMENEIKLALPQALSSERFQRVALTAFNSNKDLQRCDPASFLAAMMTSAQLGLEPNTPLGQAYLMPYGSSVQFQIGYKGLLELAQRSGKIKAIYAHAVHEKDYFELEYGLNQNLIHKPVLKDEDRGETIGFYAVVKLLNDGEMFVFMSKSEILQYAKKYSKTFSKGPWQTEFDAMAKKTVLKQVLKYAPISIEMEQTLVSDGTVKKEISNNMFDVASEENSEYIDIEGSVSELTE